MVSSQEDVWRIAQKLTNPQKRELLRRFRFFMTTILVPVSMRRGQTVALRSLESKNLVKGYRLTNLGRRVAQTIVCSLIDRERDKLRG